MSILSSSKFINFLFIKGYKNFKKNHNPNIINFILSEISNRPCINKKNKKINPFKLDDSIDFELSLRQLILARYADPKFITSNLFLGIIFLKKNIFFLPDSYLKEINKTIKISFLFSKIGFKIILILRLIYSIKVLVTLLRNNNYFEQNSIQLHGLPLEAKNYDIKSLNLINWIINILNKDNNMNVSHIYGANDLHNSSSLFLRTLKTDQLFNAISAKNKIILIIWFIKKFMISLFDSFSGRWWSCLLIGESLKLKYLQLVPKANIPKYQFFTLSDTLYRPLWTYFLENNNLSKIIFINYGASISGNIYNRNLIHYPGFTLQSWNNRFEYSKSLVNYYKKIMINNFDYKLFNNIYWLDDYKIKIASTRKNIIVFDTYPSSEINRIKFLYFEDLAKTKFAIKFLKDIVTFSKNNNLNLIIKTKKISQTLTSNTYINYLTKISNDPNIQVVQKISPTRLLENSIASISYPFTSTSIVANNINLKTCFYKVTPYEEIDNLLSQGIKVIYNSKDLQKWFINNK